MILADKIIQERKRNGWSQEELAEMLHVSRQSVSKWEGAQSVPDMRRIVELSRLFGVSCDYLLRDDVDAPEKWEEPEERADSSLPQVSLEEAQRYLRLKHESAPLTALGVFLCIFGAAMLILLGGLGEQGALGRLSGDAAGALGMVVLLLSVAGAVSLFLYTGRRDGEFAYLEKGEFETAYGVDGMVRQCAAQYQERYRVHNSGGIILCILAVVPLFAVQILSAEGGELPMILATTGMLLTIAVGAALIINASTHTSSTEVLLQTGSYTPEKKRRARLLAPATGAYWLLATAIYLGWSFQTGAWGKTWAVWPVAGVLFPVTMGAVGFFMAKKEKQ